MSNLRYLIPFIISFFIPWTHRLYYENLGIALPDLDTTSRHFTAIIVMILSIVIYAIGSSIHADRVKEKEKQKSLGRNT